MAQDTNPDRAVAQGLALLTNPDRILDTRETGRDPGVVRLSADANGQRPYWADVALVNITATNTSDAGYVVAWNCGERPQTSNLNFGTDDTEANLAFVPLAVNVADPFNSGAELCVYTSAPADLVVDLQGWGRSPEYWVLP